MDKINILSYVLNGLFVAFLVLSMILRGWLLYLIVIILSILNIYIGFKQHQKKQKK